MLARVSGSVGPGGCSCTRYNLDADRGSKADLLMKTKTCLFSFILLWFRAEGSSCWARVPWPFGPFALPPHYSPSMSPFCLKASLPLLQIHSIFALWKQTKKTPNAFHVPVTDVNVSMLLQHPFAAWPSALRRKGADLGVLMRCREHLVCWERHWCPHCPSGVPSP